MDLDMEKMFEAMYASFEQARKDSTERLRLMHVLSKKAKFLNVLLPEIYIIATSDILPFLRHLSEAALTAERICEKYELKENCRDEDA